MKQTAVEWLAEKLEYVNWMRNRDEIFPELADKWRKHYLEQAKEMEKEQIINFAKKFSDFNGLTFNEKEVTKEHLEKLFDELTFKSE